MPWERCNHKMPCPVCGKDRYCTYKPEAGIVKCTKISEGAFKVARDKAGNAFFHKHDFEDWKPTPISLAANQAVEGHPAPNSRFWQQLTRASCNAPRRRLVQLSGEIGIPVQNLVDWNVGWLTRDQLWQASTKCTEDGAWTFPMRTPPSENNPNGDVVGMRIRTENDAKYSVKHSQIGLFYRSVEAGANLLVVDGASDAIAGDTYGLNVIGRPSSNSGQEIVIKAIKELDPPKLFVMLDRDARSNPAYESIFESARELASYSRFSTIFYSPPPHKDLRQWLTNNPQKSSLPTKLSRLVSGCTRTGSPSAR